MSVQEPLYSGKFSSEPDDFQAKCDEILHHCETSQHILSEGRNTLKAIRLNEQDCVIKAFKTPSFPQNYSYGLISDSKAKKSYTNGIRLIKKGFLTPQPIGYFEQRSGGKLTKSYYACAYSEAKTLSAHLKGNSQIPEELITHFAHLCVRLHSQGVLHRDFNPLNILVETTESEPTFSLVDINRISWFDKISLRKAMDSMSRLFLPREIESMLLMKYAELRTLDLKMCQELLDSSKRKTERYFKNKKKLRKIFPKK